MATPSPADFPPGYLEQYRGDQLVAFAGTMIALQVIAVGLRSVARWYSRLAVGWEDLLILITLLSGLGMCITSILQIQYGGGGYHIAAVELSDPAKLLTFAKITLPFSFLYQIGSALPRIAICLLLLRILVDRWQRQVCYVIIAIVSGQCLSGAIVNWLQCFPLSYFWDKTIPGGWCIDQNDYWRWSTFPSIITDLAMLTLPIYTISKIQLSWKDKIGLLVTFLFGWVGLAVAVLRFAIYLSVNNIGPTADATWESVPEGIVSVAEVSVYILVVCLPSYRSFYLTARGARASRRSQNYKLRSSYPWSKKDVESSPSSSVNTRSTVHSYVAPPAPPAVLPPSANYEADAATRKAMPPMTHDARHSREESLIRMQSDVVVTVETPREARALSDNSKYGRNFATI